MPQAALEAIAAAYGEIQSQGPFGLKTSEWVIHESNLTRQAIGSELGVAAGLDRVDGECHSRL